MADLTASNDLVSDSNGDVSVSDVTSTEIGVFRWRFFSDTDTIR